MSDSPFVARVHSWRQYLWEVWPMWVILAVAVAWLAWMAPGPWVVRAASSFSTGRVLSRYQRRIRHYVSALREGWRHPPGGEL